MKMPSASPRARATSTLACALAIAACAPAQAQALHGAGATFPAPVYEAWADAWTQHAGAVVRYDPVGSGFGVELMTTSHVDFGATDAPLPVDRLAAAGLLQFPAVIGAVVPVVNIAGIAPGRLALNAATISAIYRGVITNWRDPAIEALNPSLALPDARITVVHRADASGTTWLWSRWLAGADPTWKTQLGSGTTLAWPTGDEGLGNEGVASLVQRTRASIGYVAWAYARAHRLSDVALPTRDGPVVRASRASFEAAVAAAHWRSSSDLEQDLIDEPGRASWPIVGSSFVLVVAPRCAPRPTPAPPSRLAATSSPSASSMASPMSSAMSSPIASPMASPMPASTPAARTVVSAVSPDAFAFFDWAMTAGAAIANGLGYVALPADAVRLVEARIRGAASAAPSSTPAP